VGKELAAVGLAQALTCPERPEVGCGTCASCLRVGTGLHPDVLLLREEDEDTIKIDVVREICHQMKISPIEAPAKICIIDEVHRMSQASANAFLKTLEEPRPDRYFWLLTTQPGSLLPTIVSRCLQFTFRPETALESASPEESAEALQLFEELMRTKHLPPLLAALGDKPKTLFFVQTLQKALRDTLLAPSTGSQAQRALSAYSPHALLGFFDEAVVLEGRLRSNASYGLLLESYLARNFLSPV
jgi:hypothetical protein